MFGVVMLVTFIMPTIYSLFVATVVVSCLFIWVAEWQLMHIMELISTGYGQITEILDSIGIKLFVLAPLIECYSFVCLCCIVPVSMHDRLYLVTVCMKVLQNGRLLRFSKRSDCWCTFSCSICNQNGHFIMVYPEQQFPRLWQHTQIMGEHHQLKGIVVKNQN